MWLPSVSRETASFEERLDAGVGAAKLTIELIGFAQTTGFVDPLLQSTGCLRIDQVVLVAIVHGITFQASMPREYNRTLIASINPAHRDRVRLPGPANRAGDA